MKQRCQKQQLFFFWPNFCENLLSRALSRFFGTIYFVVAFNYCRKVVMIVPGLRRTDSVTSAQVSLSLWWPQSCPAHFKALTKCARRPVHVLNKSLYISLSLVPDQKQQQQPMLQQNWGAPESSSLNPYRLFSRQSSGRTKEEEEEEGRRAIYIGQLFRRHISGPEEHLKHVHGNRKLRRTCGPARQILF